MHQALKKARRCHVTRAMPPPAAAVFHELCQKPARQGPAGLCVAGGVRPAERGRHKRFGSVSAVKTHTIGTDSFGIFETVNKTSLLMTHFIWGKKDFRIFLERKGTAAGTSADRAAFRSKSDGDYFLSRLQYLFEFEWYDFDGVCGHGLAHDEVRWKKGGTSRYVELPQHFFEVAAEIACRDFQLQRKGATAAAL